MGSAQTNVPPNTLTKRVICGCFFLDADTLEGVGDAQVDCRINPRDGSTPECRSVQREGLHYAACGKMLSDPVELMLIGYEIIYPYCTKYTFYESALPTPTDH